jgi:nucleoredoxin
MKFPITLLIFGACAISAFAGFENWTSKDGREAELELVSVSEADGEKVGTFRMRNGKTVTLKSSDLTDADAERLAEFKPEVAAEEEDVEAAGPSVFDKVLDGNLVKLEGKSFKRHAPAAEPKKYYIFYYTASWCPPCQAYTPSLVEFYKKNKNDNFEIVLITSDQDEGDMKDYAIGKKMEWPHLKMSRVEKFEKEFNHGVSGIPSVITCDLEGKIVSRTESIAELEKLVK